MRQLTSGTKKPSNVGQWVAGATLLVSLMVVGCSPSKSPNTDSRMMEAAAEAEAAEAELAALQGKGSGLAGQSGGAKGSKRSSTSKSASVRKAKQDQRAPAATKADRGEVAYIVQVGSYKMKENADQVLAKIKAEGLPVSMKTSTTPSGVELYVVRFEPTPSKSEAESFKSKAKDLVGAEAAILSR